ncbi:putative ribonuclease [Scale drop disease virus]|uniref:ORF_025R n=1 Tax=Scale drop disease virus TaxID=1697349 RepID=A0A0K1L734_9VIRU|nr:ORF_025R [Scale drop disease virus]AKU37440.1 ORF_025R [Scale drop disease virus]QLI60697.1 putative ribonuclease [Scale drop disease virus]QXJ13615.1 ORF025R [Scale drop disease virus]UNH60758.1 putative ribonuclease [Scale drop disease virus]
MNCEWRSYVVNYLLIKCCEIDSTFAHQLFDNNVDVFKSVFTSSKTDPVQNYEYLELIGDGVIGMGLPLYFMERFPILKQHGNDVRVGIISRLKLIYLSGTRMSAIAEKLGFLKWIKCFNKLKHTSYQEQQKLMEDCFEAFFGALITTFDDAKGITCSGQIVCYRFLRSAYNLIPISLDNLVDNKTMLKEIIDTNRAQLQSFVYTYDKNVMTLSVASGKYVVSDKNTSGVSKKEMEKIVAGQMLSILSKDGFIHYSEK